MKVWTEVRAVLAEEPLEWSVWCEAFDRHGLPGTVQHENPPALSAYVAPGDVAMIPALRSELLDLGAISVETSEVEEKDWAEAWKQFFKPRRFGTRLVVCPSWETFAVSSGDILITLDPGQAFGTGDHPTTRGCLEQLERVGCSGLRVADIGCGSGILSVAAMLLGAKSCVGVDTDSPAVEATAANAALNGVEIEAICGAGFEELEGREPYDLVLSNIISAALIRLAPSAAQFVKPGGRWIVSGIILANWPDVDKAATRAGFQLVENQVLGEWVTATFRR